MRLAVPAVPVLAQDTIKVGVLHSLSGTMAISETVLKDVTLMAIDENQCRGRRARQEARSGGRRIRRRTGRCSREGAPAADQDKVAVVFRLLDLRCRASVLPVFEELNGLLFYPVQYEVRGVVQNVLYRRRANQQAIPRSIPDEQGGEAAPSAGCCSAPDYVYPRTTNKILRAFLKVEGRR